MHDNEPDLSEPLKDAIRHANAAQFPDLDKIHAELRQKSRYSIAHTPRKEGPYLVCVSCDHKHTLQYIGPLKLFKGTDAQGNYILEDIKFS